MTIKSSQLAIAVSLVLARAATAQIYVQGPSSSATPYVVAAGPQALNTTITSILTVGNTAQNGYKMVGIPDGMGAYDNNNGTFTVLLNHELGAGAGVSRAHGAIGSFVSKWVINKSDFSVVSGSDLIQSVSTWNTGTSTYNAPASGVVIGRLCSGDLAKQSAYFDVGTGFGTQNLIFQSGEETGAEGRTFAHMVTGANAGVSFELPRLGKFSWENSVANPNSGLQTVVLGTDDATPGQVYMYVGTKTNTGNDIQKAGLTNGNLFGIKVATTNADRFESRGTGFDGVAGNKDVRSFSLVNHGNVENTTGANLQLASAAANVTEFLRPEDIAWDPNNAAKAYFVTTDRFDNGGGTVGASRLWELEFTSTNDFTMGGTVKMLIEGTGAADGQMFDNMTVTANGKIIIQEDPGNQAYLAKTWSYDIATGALSELLVSDAARFAAPTFPFSRDEESSGVIDITDIMNDGQTYYLANMQAHYSIAGELVEGGQLYVVAVPEPASAGVIVSLGLMGIGVLRRRRAARA